MKWGIIGTGNMGKVLIQAWLDSGMIIEEDLYITNRTLAKALALKEQYPNIQVCSSVEEVAEKANFVFVCVKPLDVNPLLKKLNPYLTPDKCIVSITSPYSVERLEQNVTCQAARIIPSITNRALAGVTLFSFGKSIKESMKTHLLENFKHFSTPIEIEESITRVASDIVSCGPAFFSYIIQRFIQSACEETAISSDKATSLATEMFIGLGKLLEDGHYTLPTLQEKVCVKGGVTGEGIQVLEHEIGAMFNHLFQKTHQKFNKDHNELDAQ